MKGAQRREQTVRKLGMSRAAPWPRESHTAPQKRGQSQAASSSGCGGLKLEAAGDVVGDLGRRGRGVEEMIERTWVRS